MNGWTELLERVLARHGLVLGAIALVAAGTFGGALFVHPLDPDNLVALSVGPLHDPWSYFSGAAHTLYRPFYRPAAELTLWLQYHLVGLQPHSYFAVNVALWAACACLLYAFVYLATGSRAIGAAAGLATMLDGRAILEPLWVLERQSSIAMLAGLCAMLLVVVPGGRRRLLWAAVCLLLLVAALSKEYGLAFAAAVPLLVYLQRVRDRRAFAIAAAASTALYIVFRLGIAGGAAGRYCEQMGYFRSTRTVCYSDYASLDQISQKLWNAAATFVGTFLPPLFDPYGALVTPAARSLLVAAIVTGAALVAYVKRPRWALPLLALVLVNAALNFVLFRTRNQVIGIGGVYAAAAIGLHWAYGTIALRARRQALIAMAGSAVLITGWLAQQAVLRPRTVQSFQEIAAASDACAAARRFRHEIDPSVVRRLKQRYKLPNPDCR